MIAGSAKACRSMISSSTRRIGANASTQCYAQLRRLPSRLPTGKEYKRLHSSLVASRKSGTSIPSFPKQHYLLRQANKDSGNKRSMSSSAPPSSKPASSGSTEKKKTASSELVPNLALASVLGGFVTFVFLYSMNAVGRGDGDASEGNDPLAQLKAEAQDAREHRDRVESGGRMTDDEIRALESGLVRDHENADGDRIITDVAVAAPADIAALEEEANLKIFRKQQNEGKEPEGKKKPWWRFGF